MPAEPARLQRLVDARDVDGVLALVGTTEIACAWCAWSAGQAKDNADRWAAELLHARRFATREELLRETLVKLTVYATDDATIAVIGSGPLEEFIVADEGRVHWMEQQADASPRFRRALSHASIRGSQPQWVCERIELAAGTAIAEPDQGRSGSPAEPRVNIARGLFRRVRMGLRVR
jgi:hypothetical protein